MTTAQLRESIAGTDPRPDRIGDAWEWLTVISRARGDALIEALRAARILGARLERGEGTMLLRQPVDCTVADWLDFRKRYLLPVAADLTALLRGMAQ